MTYSEYRPHTTFLCKTLKRPEIELMDFDSYELRVINEGIVDSDEANVTFKDIGGLEDELEEVKVVENTTINPF